MTLISISKKNGLLIVLFVSVGKVKSLIVMLAQEEGEGRTFLSDPLLFIIPLVPGRREKN